MAEFREFWRAMLPLDELFDVVIDSSEVGMRKPDPRIFHLALESLGGVEPGRAVFLDDYPGNVVAAQSVGMHAILVETDHLPALGPTRRPGGLSYTTVKHHVRGVVALGVSYFQ